MVTLAKFIMARYFLVAILDIDDLDISEKESELVNKALSEFNSVEDLEKALDNYIKENDWTGNLGSEGSGDRERGLAIEGCISRADIHANESINEFFESVYREAVPAGYAILVDGKVWENGVTEKRAKKIAEWLTGKGKFKNIRVLSPKEQDRKGIENWSYDEKKALGL